MAGKDADGRIYFGEGYFRQKKSLAFAKDDFWQGRRDSNSQHPVLETGALPIELRP